MMKRTLDVCVALVGLLLLWPLLLVIGIAVYASSGRPILYRGVRTGRLGRPFRILKFRTMVANAEHLGGGSTARDDPRITRVGRFLRRHKLDELPQLANVLVGDMSLVGPRPEATEVHGPLRRGGAGDPDGAARDHGPRVAGVRAVG
ncbi:MAG: sugar transferase [Gemmatimonadaceae bacterium]